MSALQNLGEKIDQKYRVRLILDNLPVTTYDLEENPESVRPGYEVGYEKDGKRYVNNHLMFKILVHQTNGQYTRAKENMAEIEAAAIVEVGRSSDTRSQAHTAELMWLLICCINHKSTPNESLFGLSGRGT